MFIMYIVFIRETDCHCILSISFKKHEVRKELSEHKELSDYCTTILQLKYPDID